MKARLNNTAPLYGDRDPAASVVQELAPGTELEIVRNSSYGGKEWFEVTLSSGQKGFLLGSNQLIALEDVVLDQDRVSLRRAPGRDSAVLGEIARNDRLVVLETVPPAAGQPGPGWCLVRHAGLGEGYVPGNARIRPANVPELTWWRSFLGGGKIIAGMAAIGAIVLAVRGEWSDAVMLIVLCFVTGGLAGIVHYLTTPLREKEFGPHVSWGLVLATYLGSVGLFLFLLETWGGFAADGSVRSVFDPLFINLLVGLCIATGYFFGTHEQRQRHQEDGRPWTWRQRFVPLVGALALGALLIGAISLLVLHGERPLALEASEPPQEIALRDLLNHGYGKNRYLHLKNFLHAEKWVVEETTSTPSAELRGWAILVPGAEPKKGSPPSVEAAKVPRRVFALVSASELGKAGEAVQPGPRLVHDRLTQALVHEQIGMKVMVMNGLERLSPAVRRGLLKLAPDTDLDQVLILSTRARPKARGEWEERNQFWLVLTGMGAIFVAASWVWGRRPGA